MAHPQSLFSTFAGSKKVASYELGCLKTYDLGYRSAFETLNNQLFERYIRRTHGLSVIRFRVINGAGGDGGVEAYAEIAAGENIAIQSKWFRNALDAGKIGQIKNSFLKAKRVRPQIKQYIICIPHDVSSQKIGRGKTVTVNHEEKKINYQRRKNKLVYSSEIKEWNPMILVDLVFD
jgi:hypothetical protein